MSTDAAPGATTNLKQHVIGRRQRKKDLKKQAVEALTNEAKTDYLLTMIPGRMFGNGATNSACIFTQQGRKGTNQDAMVVWEVSKMFIPFFTLNLHLMRRTRKEQLVLGLPNLSVCSFELEGLQESAARMF